MIMKLFGYVEDGRRPPTIRNVEVLLCNNSCFPVVIKVYIISFLADLKHLITFVITSFDFDEIVC